MKIKRRRREDMKEIEEEVKVIKEEKVMKTYLLEFGSGEEVIGKVVIVAENVFDVLNKFIAKYQTQDAVENLFIDISIADVIQ